MPGSKKAKDVNLRRKPTAAHIQDREQGKAHPLQKPEYCISTLVEKGKWGRDGTGFTPVAGLWSELTKERMTQDVRKVQSIYRYPKQLYNAFDRGDVTVNWDFTTTKDTKYMAQKKMTAVKRCKATINLPNYIGPQQRVEKLLTDRKEAAEQQREARNKLVETYGEEGAAQIDYIEELKAKRGPQHARAHRKCRLSKADKQYVLDLPDY